jgi:hypothetical protein
MLGDRGIPTVIHCGSGPVAGKFTGAEPMRALLHRHPRLPLIIAHLGSPEFVEFLDLAEEFDSLFLDTTMVFTDFTERMAEFPRGELDRLGDLGDRILFGSDFPNIPYGYAEAVHHLIDLPGVDDAWRRNVLHDNAAKLFGLS